MDRKALEKLLPNDEQFRLDASDFACISTFDLSILNGLIAEVGHELYSPEQDIFMARGSVVSLINLGLLPIRRVHGARQYA